MNIDDKTVIWIDQIVKNGMRVRHQVGQGYFLDNRVEVPTHIVEKLKAEGYLQPMNDSLFGTESQTYELKERKPDASKRFRTPLP